MINQESKISINVLARTAGILYLIVIGGGIFSEVFVRQELIAYGDPSTTASNILNNENLYRWGFVVQIIYLICNIPLVLIFHELFKRTNKSIALLFLVMFLTANTIEIMNMINHYLPLDLLEAGVNLDELESAKAATLAYLSLLSHSIGFSIALVFFGCYCILIGYLIVKSDLIPSLIGSLMLLAGICYLFDSFSLFLAPEFAKELFPYILLPCLIAESSFAIWLLIKGVELVDKQN